MVNYCCVQGCGRNNKTNKQIHYYGFPKEKHRQVEWLCAIGREDLLEKNVRLSHRVCSRHFTPNSIKNKHLCANAVPTLCLPNSVVEEEIKEEKIPHESIFCNSCNDQILGFRYKCLSCTDYDICSKCEMFEVHSEHYMLRISKPAKFKTVEELISKWHFLLHTQNVLSGSQDIQDTSSDDDLPITAYMKHHDSGIDLSEDIKTKIRNEVTRALSINQSTPEKRHKKPFKRKSKNLKKTKDEPLFQEENEEDASDENELVNVPEVAFADVNDIRNNQAIDIKDEMPILLSQLMRDGSETQLVEPAIEAKLSTVNDVQDASADLRLINWKGFFKSMEQ